MGGFEERGEVEVGMMRGRRRVKGRVGRDGGGRCKAVRRRRARVWAKAGDMGKGEARMEGRWCWRENGNAQSGGDAARQAGRRGHRVNVGKTVVNLSCRIVSANLAWLRLLAGPKWEMGKKWIFD